VSLKHCSEELREWRDSRSTAAFEKISGLSMPEKVRGLEIECIKKALNETNGNKLKASKLLGITRQGLDKKMKGRFYCHYCQVSQSYNALHHSFFKTGILICPWCKKILRRKESSPETFLEFREMMNKGLIKI